MQSAHLENKFHGISWNVSSSMKPGSITKFHGMSWLRECTLCLIFIVKSEVWTIFNFLGLGHETMVCTVCLSIFLMNSMSSPKPCNKFHVIPRNCESFMELGVKRNSMEFYGILLPPNTMFVIYAWINGWVNNREAGDLRHHRAHYDVIAMNNYATVT